MKMQQGELPHAKAIQARDTAVKLDIRGISKRYGAVTAIDNVSVQVRDGEFLTLLGPSGSGKTTLLTVVVGLTTPDDGEVRIDGKAATYAPPHERDIGMVFQNYALFPHLTVFENIAFPLRMRGRSKTAIAAEVKRVLDIVELGHTADRLPRQLSGGQQQRIALARCMVYQPSIIVMDEPLGALDKRLRDTMQVEIKRLHSQYGITILYVTHDQDEALALSDRICLMRDGGIEQLGTPHELYFEPRTVFAANFIGDSNVFHGKVRTVSGDSVVLEVAGGLLIETGAPKAPFSAGDPICVMVRPEHVRLMDDGADGCNRFTGHVESKLFAGSMMKVFCRSVGGIGLQAKLAAARDGRWLDSARLALGWNREDVVILEEGSAS